MDISSAKSPINCHLHIVTSWTPYLGGYLITRCNKIVPNIFGSMIINPYLCITFVTEGGPSILQPALYSPHHNTEGSITHTKQ